MDIAKTDVTISFEVSNDHLCGGLQYAADALEPATAAAMATFLQVTYPQAAPELQSRSLRKNVPQC